LFVVFVGVSLVTTSGAFSSVTAERTVNVNVAGDGSALLELEPHGTSPNGAYANTPGGELEISFSDVSATGVNRRANTTLTNVFNITNQGTQPADVYITENGPNASLVTFEDETGSRIDGGATNAASAGVGETVQVTIVINTTVQDLSGGDTLLNSITIHAEA